MKHRKKYQKYDLDSTKNLQDKLLGKELIKYPVLLIIVSIYLYIGFAYSLWHPGWIILLIIPLYYQLAFTLMRPNLKKKLIIIPTLCLATCIYLYIGLEHSLWHPGWLVYMIALIFIWPIYAKDI